MCPKVTELHKSEIRGRIIRAAMESFTQTGYDKTKMEDISKRLGLSKGTLYLYFKSKDDLFTALSCRMADELVDGDEGDLGGAIIVALVAFFQMKDRQRVPAFVGERHVASYRAIDVPEISL